eukprot:PhF_6_TR9224/c0_g1_i1/m.14513
MSIRTDVDSLTADENYGPVARRLRDMRMVTEQSIILVNHLKSIGLIALLLVVYTKLFGGNIPALFPESGVQSVLTKEFLTKQFGIPIALSGLVGWYQGATNSKTTRTTRFYFKTDRMQTIAVLSAVTHSILRGVGAYVLCPILLESVVPKIISVLHAIELYPMYLSLGMMTLLGLSKNSRIFGLAGAGGLLTLLCFPGARAVAAFGFRFFIGIIALGAFGFSVLPNKAPYLAPVLLYCLGKYTSGYFDYLAQAVCFPTKYVFSKFPYFGLSDDPPVSDSIAVSTVMASSRGVFKTARGGKALSLLFSFALSAYGMSCCVKAGVATALAQRVLCHLSFVIPQILLVRAELVSVM